MQADLERTRQDILRYLVATSGTMLSILIALHRNDGNALHIRLAFALSVVSLGLGVLLLSIRLYGWLYNKQALVERYAKAKGSSGVTTYREPRFFALCQSIGLVCLGVGVVLLLVYMLLLALG